jgi:predicted RecA/RadA family phage recombinase
MLNYIQPGKTITMTPGADVASGVGFIAGNLFGVATNDVASGTAGEFLTEGVVEIAKVAPLVINVGDRVFWNVSTKNVDKTATAKVNVGTCVVAALSADTTVQIKLGATVPAGT